MQTEDRPAHLSFSCTADATFDTQHSYLTDIIINMEGHISPWQCLTVFTDFTVCLSLGIGHSDNTLSLSASVSLFSSSYNSTSKVLNKMCLFFSVQSLVHSKIIVWVNFSGASLQLYFRSSRLCKTSCDSLSLWGPYTLRRNVKRNQT